MQNGVKSSRKPPPPTTLRLRGLTWLSFLGNVPPMPISRNYRPPTGIR